MENQVIEECKDTQYIAPVVPVLKSDGNMSLERLQGDDKPYIKSNSVFFAKIRGIVHSYHGFQEIL